MGAVVHGRAVRFRSSVHVLIIEPGPHFDIRPVLVDRRIAKSETFAQTMARMRPYAAINGTFYDNNLKPLGDIVADGKLINRGCYTNALAITSGNRVEIIRRESRGFPWSRYKAGLAAGPRLLEQGRADIRPLADGFTQMDTISKAPRSDVGLTRSHKLILVTVEEPISLYQFADLMRGMGAVEAMNLDGGGACALYIRGNVLVRPSLPMTNLLVVYKRR
jgi:exopolysaccharide biosynthesis protein